MKKIFLLFSLIWFFVSPIVYAIDIFEDLGIPSQPTERITDLAEILPDDQEIYLNQKLESLDDAHNVEAAIITLVDLEWYAIEEVAFAIADNRKVGKDWLDSGIVIVVSMDEKQRRIETGYGVEWDIPDILAQRMGRDIIVPAFREWDYASGFDELIDTIQSILAGVFVDTPEAANPDINDSIGRLIMLWLLSFVIATILRGVFGKDIAKRKLAANIWPWTTWLLWLIVGWGLSWAFMLFMIMSLLRSMVMLAQQVSGSGNRNPWWWGFAWWSWGWWWGSFGGWFSGFGGGSFGGGGASGSW